MNKKNIKKKRIKNNKNEDQFHQIRGCQNTYKIGSKLEDMDGQFW